MEWLEPLLQFLRNLLFVTFVYEWQGAVHLRRGRYVRTLTPGWWLTVPGLDSVWKVNVLTKTQDVGPLPLTTADGVAVTAAAVVTWRVGDVKLFQTTCDDPKEVLHDAATGALAHAVLTHPWVAVPTEPFIAAVCTAVRKSAKRYGIRVLGMRWTGITQATPRVVWNIGSAVTVAASIKGQTDE